MKKLFLFLMLAIGFASCDGLNPIDPPEVVKYTITATYDDNVTISPVNVLVENGKSAILDVITKTGYTSTVKVNGTVVPLTSSSLTLANVVADMKVEATSSLIVIKKLKQFTLTAKSNGNGTITPEVVVVDSGKSATFTITPKAGCIVDAFKVNDIIVSLTSNSYTVSNVNSDKKLDVTFKEDLSPYFFNTKWRLDSIYNRPIGGTYVVWGYAYPGEEVIQFTSHGTFLWFTAGIYNNADVSHWSVDKTQNPVRLYLNGREYKIELLTEKKLICSSIQKGGVYPDGTRDPDYEYKETYIPEP